MGSQEQRRTLRRRGETRARLLRAARTLMLEQGLEAASIDAVTRTAGYTRGAFYSNFTSLDDLVVALYVEHITELLEDLQQARAASAATGPPQNFAEAVDRVVNALPFDPEWFQLRIVLRAHARRDPAAFVSFIEQEQALRHALSPVLVEAMAYSGRRLTVTPDQFAEAVVAAHDGALANELHASDPRHLRLLLCRSVIAGLTEPDIPRSASHH